MVCKNYDGLAILQITFMNSIQLIHSMKTQVVQTLIL